MIHPPQEWLDRPLEFYPGVIATLIQQRTLKIVKAELRAKGKQVRDFSRRDLVLLAEAYFASHRDECLKVAIDTVRTGAELQRLAEKEARQRPTAAPKPKDITPIRQLITYSKG
jgi:hypothetical protein